MTIDIESGLGIDETTGEMLVSDRPRAERELGRSDDPCDRAVLAIVTGDHARAAVELDAAAPGLRRDALRGELARVGGDAAGAVTSFAGLLDSDRPTGLRRATVLQHLGKAEYAAGRHADALAHLTEALRLRLDGGAPADQVASSRLMINIVQQAPAVSRS